ncbi:MAG: sensor domain-containing diguanylate cyclase [Sulfurimonas sp.]|nr:sensor domain-containing diguanylate cyclase [Sulfurimonas sp.]
MKNIFLSVIIFCSTLLFSQEIISLHDTDIKIKDFNMSYFIDNSGEMPLNEVTQETFIDSKNKISLGIKAKTTWAKIIIANKSKKDKKLFLHHPYAYHVKLVEFYVQQKNKTIKSIKVDFDEKLPKSTIYGTSAIFSFILPENQTRTLYIKTVSYTHQWFKLQLFDEENSKRALLNTNNDIAILFGILFSLAIYNFIIFIVSRTKENIYYSLYLLSASIWLALSYGLLATFFEIYGMSIFKLHISLMLMPIFLLLFLMTIFNTKEQYKTEHKSLLFILILITIDAFYGLFDIINALKYSSSLAGLMILITLFVSISFYRKKDPLAKYFLIGHLFFIFFNAIAILYYKGIIEFNYITSHAVGIGILLESLLLGFILSYRIKILEDIKKSQEKLKLLAITDHLTSLYNRRYFNTSAEHILKISKRKGHDLSIIMMDIDSFKMINDTYGHMIGDDVLVRLSAKLKEIGRESDIICRFGGEEFIILLPETNLAGAITFAEKIRKEIELIRISSNKQKVFSFTLSLGVSQVDCKNDLNVEAAVNKADTALYQAKNSGKNKVCSS